MNGLINSLYDYLPGWLASSLTFVVSGFIQIELTKLLFAFKVENIAEYVFYLLLFGTVGTFIFFVAQYLILSRFGSFKYKFQPKPINSINVSRFNVTEPLKGFASSKELFVTVKNVVTCKEVYKEYDSKGTSLIPLDLLDKLMDTNTNISINDKVVNFGAVAFDRKGNIIYANRIHSAYYRDEPCDACLNLLGLSGELMKKIAFVDIYHDSPATINLTYTCYESLK